MFAMSEGYPAQPVVHTCYRIRFILGQAGRPGPGNGAEASVRADRFTAGGFALPGRTGERDEHSVHRSEVPIPLHFHGRLPVMIPSNIR